MRAPCTGCLLHGAPGPAPGDESTSRACAGTRTPRRPPAPGSALPQPRGVPPPGRSRGGGRVCWNRPGRRGALRSRSRGQGQRGCGTERLGPARPAGPARGAAGGARGTASPALRGATRRPPGCSPEPARAAPARPRAPAPAPPGLPPAAPPRPRPSHLDRVQRVPHEHQAHAAEAAGQQVLERADGLRLVRHGPAACQDVPGRRAAALSPTFGWAGPAPGPPGGGPTPPGLLPPGRFRERPRPRGRGLRALGWRRAVYGAGGWTEFGGSRASTPRAPGPLGGVPGTTGSPCACGA